MGSSSYIDSETPFLTHIVLAGEWGVAFAEIGEKNDKAWELYQKITLEMTIGEGRAFLK